MVPTPRNMQYGHAATSSQEHSRHLKYGFSTTAARPTAVVTITTRICLPRRSNIGSVSRWRNGIRGSVGLNVGADGPNLRKTLRLLRLTWCAAFAVAVAGCDRHDEQIKLYRVVKAPVENPASTQPVAPPSSMSMPPTIRLSAEPEPASAQCSANECEHSSHSPLGAATLAQMRRLVSRAWARAAQRGHLTGYARPIERRRARNVNRCLASSGSHRSRRSNSPRSPTPARRPRHVAVVDLAGKPEQGDPNRMDASSRHRSRATGTASSNSAQSGPGWRGKENFLNGSPPPSVQMIGSVRCCHVVKLTIACLAAATVLVFAGTLAQVNYGIHIVQERYFQSLFVWWPPAGSGLKVPGFSRGHLIAQCFSSTIAAHVRRSVGLKNLGITYSCRIIVMLAGGLLTDCSPSKATCASPRESKEYSEDQRGM